MSEQLTSGQPCCFCGEDAGSLSPCRLTVDGYHFTAGEALDTFDSLRFWHARCDQMREALEEALPYVEDAGCGSPTCWKHNCSEARRVESLVRASLNDEAAMTSANERVNPSDDLDPSSERDHDRLSRNESANDG